MPAILQRSLHPRRPAFLKLTRQKMKIPELRRRTFWEMQDYLPEMKIANLLQISLVLTIRLSLLPTARMMQRKRLHLNRLKLPGRPLIQARLRPVRNHTRQFQ
ncbi:MULTISPECIES: hypothetical protein [unclassified Bilifractor]|uniref:hypothetical protein n=1 Tax=unclassified Bilifractor TaxID=2815795 RepID=UPI003F8FE801